MICPRRFVRYPKRKKENKNTFVPWTYVHSIVRVIYLFLLPAAEARQLKVSEVYVAQRSRSLVKTLNNILTGRPSVTVFRRF